MDIEQLYRDHNINYVTEGHKHSRPGWVNIECPFCTGNSGYHLGYHINGDKFVCWRCGGKPPWKAISTILKVSSGEANSILRKYGVLVGKAPEVRRKIRIKAFSLPSEIAVEPSHVHVRYLKGRDFSYKQLIKEFGIQFTGMYSKLKVSSEKSLDYKHRIIIPYYWENKIVSFDSRDITKRAANKYMACPDDRELVPRKSILYGRQDKWGSTGICVEGPTDVWRMGVNSFAVSGIKYTPAQLRLIAKTFKTVPIIFDDEPQAFIQATKLAADLKFRGVNAFVIKIIGDPGSLPQEEANYLVKSLL